MKTKVTRTKVTLLSGVFAEKVLNFLNKNPDKEYNPKTLSKILKIPYPVLKVTVWRLSETGQIWKLQRGFYSSKCNLNNHQLKKKENDMNLQFHNITIKIPKNQNMESCYFAPTGGVKVTSESNKKVTENNSKVTESNGIETIKIAPNQTLIIQETPDNFLVMISASENPLGVREFFWLTAFLRSKFGGAVEKAVLVKLDVNHDFPETYSPNQLTFGDIAGMCLAIYGKGGTTRIEGRNMNPNLPIPEFLEKLQILFQTEKTAAEEEKTPEKRNIEFIPASELHHGRALEQKNQNPAGYQ